MNVCVVGEYTFTPLIFHSYHYTFYFTMPWSKRVYLCLLSGSQSGMNSSYYGGSRGSVGMNGMGAGWGM